MTARLRGLAAVLIALTLAGCGSQDQLPVGDGQVLGQQAVYGRDDPGAGAACFLAIGDEDLARLWDLALAGNVVGEPPSAPAEFRAPAVGVFLGQRSTGGYSIAVRTAERGAEGEVVLDIVTSAPAPGEVTVTVITSPYVLYVLPDDTARVTLEGDIDVPCEARVPEVLPPGDPGRVEEEAG